MIRGFAKGRLLSAGAIVWVLCLAATYWWWRQGAFLYLAGNNLPRRLTALETLPYIGGIVGLAFQQPTQGWVERVSARKLPLAYASSAAVGIFAFSAIPLLVVNVLGSVIPVNHLPYGWVLEQQHATSIAAALPEGWVPGIAANVVFLLALSAAAIATLGPWWGTCVGAMLLPLLAFIQSTSAGEHIPLFGDPARHNLNPTTNTILLLSLALLTGIGLSAWRAGQPWEK